MQPYPPGGTRISSSAPALTPPESKDSDATIDRAKAYADVGADLIFTEALQTPAEFEQFRTAVDTPLLANMTEFGKSELLSAKQLSDIGYNVVIFPVTTLRLAMRAVEAGLREIANTGTQSGLLDQMQHRGRLYELLRYTPEGVTQ